VDENGRLTLDDVKAAAAVGRLPDLARQMVLEGQWLALDALLQHAMHKDIAVDAFTDTARAVGEAIVALGEARRVAAAEEILATRRVLSRALARRAGPTPLLETQRQAASLAALLHLELGELKPAAELFERAGDEARAAEAYGALGDLENMERCLLSEETRRTRHQAIVDGIRRAEVLAAIGERWAAVQAAAALPQDAPEAFAVRARMRELERRLCRGRAVALRVPDGRVVRICAAPVVLGRDPAVDLPVRDPTVSRRHARIAHGPDGFVVADAGSRAGTRIGGVPLAGPLPLGGEGELGLGEHCRLRYRAEAEALVLVGLTGLDRALSAVVGAGGEIPLLPGAPEARGLAVAFEGACVQLRRTEEAPVRIEGRLVGRATDLLHGDVLELPSGARWEVV
jgi:hypothetical protein